MVVDQNEHNEDRAAVSSLDDMLEPLNPHVPPASPTPNPLMYLSQKELPARLPAPFFNKKHEIGTTSASQDRTVYLNMFVESLSTKLQEKHHASRMESYNDLCKHINLPQHKWCWLISLDRRTLTTHIASTNPWSNWYYPLPQFWAERGDNLIFACDYAVAMGETGVVESFRHGSEEGNYNDLFMAIKASWLKTESELIDYSPGWKKYRDNRIIGATWP